MPLNDALLLIRRRRPQAEPIPEFMEMLRRYETHLMKDTFISVSSEPSTAKVQTKRSRDTASIGPDPKWGPSLPKRIMIGPTLTTEPQLPVTETVLRPCSQVIDSFQECDKSTLRRVDNDHNVEEALSNNLPVKK